ncbi:MAG: BtpA/SgcQ family protein [Gemmataceae bacterium]
MSRFRDAFPGRRHVLLPVVHAVSLPQALANVRVARDGGADGVFLIGHGSITDDELLAIYLDARAAHPDFWLGLNCLSWTPERLFATVGGRVQGVWIDDALIDESGDDQADARRVAGVQRECGWSGLYFGGIAFKYQRPVRDPAAAARKARPWMDVVTTSGPGTGHAAPPGKIRSMREAVGDAPLAVASGVTPENVTDYLPWADCFLAATGVSYTLEELDPARVRDLVGVVRSWRG